MRKIYQHIYLFYAAVFLLHIVNIFIGNERLNYVIGLLAVFMLVISFFKASSLFMILGGSFLFIGGYLFIQNGESLAIIPSLLTSNLSLLTLLAMLPWMNSVVRSGRFDRSLKDLMQVNVPDLGKLYVRSSGITLTLAAFLNLSAATIAQEVLKGSLKDLPTTVRNKFISTSTLRGYSLALLWSPLEVLLAVSIFLTGVSYVEILPWMLLIAGIVFVFDVLWGKMMFGKYVYGKDQFVTIPKERMRTLTRKLIHLSVALLFFLGLVIISGTLLQLDFILTVTLLIFPFAFAWSLVMKRSHSFWTIGWHHWKDKTNTMQNFIVLFISLSLFSHSIGQSQFLHLIEAPILQVAEYPLLVFFLIQFVFIFLSMFGIHPLATLGILGSLITTLLTVYSPLSIAIVLATGAIGTLTVGTYGLLVTLTAVTIEQSPYKITGYNLVYAIVYGGVGALIAYLLL